MYARILFKQICKNISMLKNSVRLAKLTALLEYLDLLQNFHANLAYEIYFTMKNKAKYIMYVCILYACIYVYCTAV